MFAYSSIINTIEGSLKRKVRRYITIDYGIINLLKITFEGIYCLIMLWIINTEKIGP